MGSEKKVVLFKSLEIKISTEVCQTCKQAKRCEAYQDWLKNQLAQGTFGVPIGKVWPIMGRGI